MDTLTRYVVSEFIKVILITLVGMTALMILVGIGREAVREGLGLVPIARLIPYVLPDAMRFAVPGTVLLAATSVFGRMASFNEMVAIKSLGISPMAVLFPVFVLAAFISLGTVWLNDIAVSWGRMGMQRVLIESVEETAYGFLKTQKSYSTKRLAINVSGVDGRRLLDPMITLKAKDGQPGGTISATAAELQANPEREELVIRLYDPVLSTDGFEGIWPGVYPLFIPLNEFRQRGNSATRPSEMSLRQIPAVAEQQRESIALLQRQSAASAVHQMLTGDFEELQGKPWAKRRKQIAEARGTLNRLHVEPHRRWANGFSCLCFAMVGAPIAIRRRHGEFLASFFACFLPVLIVYYPFLMVSVDHAKEGTWPPVSVWLGNFVFVVWGIWLTRRVLRY